MLAPIRPRPMIPSCISNLLSGARLANRLFKLLQSEANVAPEVHTQRAAATRDEHLKIAAGLRRLHDIKRVRLARHGQVRRGITGDLQEDAAVGSALVGLSRRVKKARTKTGARRYPLAVADDLANSA